MHKSTKNKVMAALTMASAVGLYGYTAPTAKGVMITQYVVDVQVATKSGFGGAVTTTVAVNPTAPAVTITSGEYVRFGIEAVMTNNAGTAGIPNPVSGSAWDTKNIADGDAAAPQYLGIESLADEVLSTDHPGTVLAPLLGSFIGTYMGEAVYNSTGIINPTINSGNWGSPLVASGATAPGDPNTGGEIGPISPLSIGFPPSSADSQSAQESTVGVPEVGAFSGTTATPSATTSVITGLGFHALGNNTTVTLTPVGILQGMNYWGVGSEGQTTSSTPPSGHKTGIKSDPSYIALGFGSGDIIAPVAPLVVTIGTPGPTGPIITLTNATTAQTQTQLTDSGTNTPGAHQGQFTPTSGGSNTLSVSGSNGSYVKATVTNIDNGAGDSGDYVTFQGFSPSSDKEIIALELLDNGTVPTSAQLAAIVADINSANDTAFGTSALASTTFPGGASPFTSPFDVYLTIPTTYLSTLGSEPFDFGFNFAGYTDATAGVANVTVEAVGLVPEPGSMLGVLALGAVGMFARRRRRNGEPESA